MNHLNYVRNILINNRIPSKTSYLGRRDMLDTRVHCKRSIGKTSLNPLSPHTVYFGMPT